MKSPRLLPVVIAATAALLLLKGIGLVTSGGYVLTGSGTAIAADEAPDPAGMPSKEGADPTMALPEEQTLEDSSPTLDDKAVTLPLAPDAAQAGEGEAAAEGEHGGNAVVAEQAAALADEQPVPMAPNLPCPPAPPVAEGETPPAPPTNCMPDPGTNEHGDAIPLIESGGGKYEVMKGEEGAEADVLKRLGERREDLDAREKELDMRMALVEAAEKRLDERTAVLKDLEAQIDRLVAEKKAAEDDQFKAIVAMYETMKPKEAATIFDELDLPVLIRVAKAISPRKMGPIMAKMNPAKAKSLTAGMATDQGEPQADLAAVEDLANLPQIVGQ